MRSIDRRAIAIGAASALVIGACGGEGIGRADAVSDLVSTNVPARYLDLADTAEALVVTVGDWCAAGEPGADPAPVSTEVADVRARWVALSPFWFGPAMDRRSRFVIDPTARIEDVAALVATTTPVDAPSLRETIGADQRGLGALDLLLTLDADRDADGARVCAYAIGTAELVAEETEALADDWATFGPTLDDGEDAANDMLGDMVNEALFALGALPTAENRAVAQAQLDGVRRAMVGPADAAADAAENDDRADTGIAELLGDDVVEQLTVEFDTAAASMDDESIDALETTIRTNVVSTLGLSIQFSDADGDG